MDETRESFKETEDHWISVSDMMTVLMAVFLFIAISYVSEVDEERTRYEDIARSWEDTKGALYRALDEEFREDAVRWQADVDSVTLAVRFKEPDVLFASGSDALAPRFKDILDEFFPRYIDVLTGPDFKDEIAEVRIEGHTNSRWNAGATPLESYLGNMELSQGRTASVLDYVTRLESISSGREWMWVRDHTIAIGFSYSKALTNPDGTEDLAASRRVEFRIVTKAQEKIEELLAESRS